MPSSAKPSSPKLSKSRSSRMPPWTVLNLVGVLLNASLFCGTIFTTYLRTITVTPMTSCAHDDSPMKRQSDQQLPGQPSRAGGNENPLIDLDKSFHIIFSSGCSTQQHWQSYVLFHSIMESGQNGHATRIASGCSPAETKTIIELHETQIKPMGKRNSTGESRFHLHLTPEFGVVPGETEVEFYYLNKPYGVFHWMENRLGYSADQPSRKEYDDIIIMLLDPDMILLRPFVNDFTTGPEIWRQRNSYPRKASVQHGYPMSQEYAFYTAWYDELKDVADIFPASELPTPAKNYTREQLLENFSAGPPYLATTRDFYKITAKWRQLAVPVQKQFPDTILSEMYAYSWAAAHLKLPHQQAHSFMVSHFSEEGFHLFNDKTKYPSNQMCRGNIPASQKPHVLHYCQHYAIGKYVLGKHRLPSDFVGSANVGATCASPLLAEPPTDVSTKYSFFILPDGEKQKTAFTAQPGVFTAQDKADRISFMLCEMIAALNRAATYYKQQHCATAGVTPNLEKSLIFHDTLEIAP